MTMSACGTRTILAVLFVGLALFGLPAISASGYTLTVNPSIVDAPLTNPPSQDFPITITRDGDLSADLDVYYNITDPTIAEIPVASPLKIPAGFATLPIILRLKATGSAYLELSAEDYSPTSIPIRVSSPVAMTVSPDPVNIILSMGSSTTVTITRTKITGGNVLNTNLTLNLISGATNFFTVTNKVIFPATLLNTQSKTIVLKGKSAGSSILTIEPDANPMYQTMYVAVNVSTNSIKTLAFEPATANIVLSAGPTTQIKLIRTGTFETDLTNSLTVALTSGATSIFTVPASTTFAATNGLLSQTNTITITGVSGGTASLVASAAGWTSTTGKVNVYSNTVRRVRLSADPVNLVMSAGPKTVEVIREGLVPGDLNSSLTVGLSALIPGYFMMDQSGVVFDPTNAVSQSIPVLFTGLSTGQSQVVVLPSSAAYLFSNVVVNVFSNQTLILPPQVYIKLGAEISVGIQRAGPTDNPLIVNLTTPNQNSFRIKGDSGTYKVSDTVTIPAGAQGAVFSLRGDASTGNNPINLTATASGYPAAVTKVWVVASCDIDQNGLPDWWELEHFGTLGVDPRGDPDGDLLLNMYEYLAGTDPNNPDSTGTGVSDYNLDVDLDQLSNGDEQDLYQTYPLRRDTDDDTINDNIEVIHETSPRISLSPYVMRAVRLVNGGTVTVPDAIPCVATSRLNLADFTVECWVNASNLPTSGRRTIISRKVGAAGRISYEMGIKDGGKPYVRFQGNSGEEIEAAAGASLVLGQWTHLAGRFCSNSLCIFIDGLPARSVNTSLKPAAGAGNLLIGGAANQGFLGDVRDIRLWKVGRSDAQIADTRSLSLFYDENVVNPGVLQVIGDGGHLRENSPAGDDQLRYWTIEAWIKTTDTDGGVIISKYNTPAPSEGDYNYFMRLDTEGRVQAGFGGQYLETTYEYSNGIPRIVSQEVIIDLSTRNHIQGVIKINDGKWHHVAYLRNPTNAILYVDGYIDGTLGAYVYPIPGANKVASGGTPRRMDGPVVVGLNLAGQLDEVRIWKAGLTTTEIRENMKQNLLGDHKDMISYFNFDNYGGSMSVVDRAALFATNLPSPEMDVGLLVPNATIGSGRVNPAYGTFTLYPFRVLGGNYLVGFFPADDGGETLEDLIHELNWDFAGVRNGQATFALVGGESPTQDSDGDTLPDSWETQHGLNPRIATGNDGAWGDPDGDGLNNRAEYLAGTDPRDFDTDGDGFGDYDSRPSPESRSYGELYSDGDGMDDAWEELYPTALSPLRYDANEDPDSDGWSNYAEFMFRDTYSSNSIIRTSPVDANSYPVPQVTYIFKYSGLKHFGAASDANAYLRVLAYQSQAMNTDPDGEIVWKTWEFGDAPYDHPLFPEALDFWEPVTISWRGCYSGHLREGSQWYFAYMDMNRDGKCDTNEPAALGKYNPANQSHGKGPEVVFELMDNPPGLPRFSWGTGHVNWPGNNWGTQNNPIYYTVTIQNMGLAGAPEILRRQIPQSRDFFCEADYMAAGIYGLPSGFYKWQVYDRYSALVGSGGTFRVTNPTSQMTPVLTSPSGSQLVFARNEFQWKMDLSATMFHLQISPDPQFNTILLDLGAWSPFRERDGSVKYQLPIYAGNETFTNRAYYWRVRGVSGGQTGQQFSPWGGQAFAVNLQDSPLGAYMISGETLYFGKAVPEKIVVEAYTSEGFCGVPDARVTSDAAGAFKLRGLRASTYYVRAFIDQNGNRKLDNWESFGFVKDPTVYAADYTPKALTVPGNKTGQRILIRDRDTDADRVPDAWEYHFFGNLTSAFNGSDFDGDGVSDYDEIMVYGSDPRDANSNPHNQPQLNVYPSLVTVWALPGQPPAQQLLKVWNSGRGGLSYTISSDVPWLSASPAFNASSGQTNTHVVSITAQGTTGDFIGHLLVNGGTGVGLQQSITVQLKVRNTIPTGSLKVDIFPLAVTAATWQVDGAGSWYKSGVTVSSLGVGYHTVTFKPVMGWKTPASLSVYVASNRITTTSALYVKNARTPLDFDGKGMSDYSVFFPGAGWLYNLYSEAMNYIVLDWSDPDIPVPADYNGDGYTDIAFFYPGRGYWVILNGDGTQRSSGEYGWNGVIPVPADYDGDGVEDVAFYDPLKGNWYILQSTLGTTRLQNWGWKDTVPVPADYDGDGKTDLAAYWPQKGAWLIQYSGCQNAVGYIWGYANVIPAPGDYDGDGKADLAVFYPPTGNWHILYSSTMTGAMIQWGFGAVVPVPADFDGDGKTDVAVYWPETGNWYVIRSSDGAGIVVVWGGGDGRPTLNQYQINRLKGICR